MIVAAAVGTLLAGTGASLAYMFRDKVGDPTILKNKILYGKEHPTKDEEISSVSDFFNRASDIAHNAYNEGKNLLSSYGEKLDQGRKYLDDTTGAFQKGKEKIGELSDSFTSMTGIGAGTALKYIAGIGGTSLAASTLTKGGFIKWGLFLSILTAAFAHWGKIKGAYNDFRSKGDDYTYNSDDAGDSDNKEDVADNYVVAPLGGGKNIAPPEPFEDGFTDDFDEDHERYDIA